MLHVQLPRWTQLRRLLPGMLLLAACCGEPALAQNTAKGPNNSGRPQSNNLQPLPQPVVIYLPPGWQPWSSARPNYAPSPYYAPYPNNSQSPYYGPPSTSALSPFPVQVQVRPYTPPQGTPTYAAPRAPMNEEIPGEDQDWPIGSRRRSPFVTHTPDHESAPLFKNPAAVPSQPTNERGLVTNQPPAQQFQIVPEKPNESGARRADAGNPLARQSGVPGAGDKVNGSRSPQSRVVQYPPTRSDASAFAARTNPQMEMAAPPQTDAKSGMSRKPQAASPNVAERGKGLLPRPGWAKPAPAEDEVALIPSERPPVAKPQATKPHEDSLADDDDEASKPAVKRGPLGALSKILPPSKSKESTTKVSPPKTSSPRVIARLAPGQEESTVSIRPAAPPIPRSNAATRDLASKMPPRIKVAGDKPAASKPASPAPAAMLEPRMVARRMSEPPAAPATTGPPVSQSGPGIVTQTTPAAEAEPAATPQVAAPIAELAQADTASVEPEPTLVAPTDATPTEVASADRGATQQPSAHVPVPHVAGSKLAAGPSEPVAAKPEHDEPAQTEPIPHLAASEAPHVASEPSTELAESPAVMPTLNANGGARAQDDGDEHLLARASRLRRRPAPAAVGDDAEETTAAPRVAAKDDDDTPLPPAVRESESRTVEARPERAIAAPREAAPKAENTDKLVSSGPKSPRVVRRNPIRDRGIVEEARRPGNPLR